MTEALFISFSLFTIAMAAGVVLARSPMFSALCLMMTFFGLSALYVLWSAPFMAMIQILIYTGAIVVLFVFVVMLLNLDKSNRGVQNWLLVAVVSGVTWFLSLILLRVLSSVQTGSGLTVPNGTGIREMSMLLFTKYLWPFEILSVFLLALIVGIYLVARPDAADGGESRG